MNPKIAFCKTTLLGPISGADEIMLNYAIHLHARGCDTRVMLLYPPEDDDQYLRRLQASGVPYVVIIPKSFLFGLLRVLRNILSSLLFFLFVMRRAPDQLRKVWQVVLGLVSRIHSRRCRRFLGANRPDLIHVFTPDSGTRVIVQAGHSLGIPVLYHEMGTARYLPMLADHYRRLERVLPMCNEVAALSPALASEWSERLPFLRRVSILPLVMERTNTFNFFSHRIAEPAEVIFGFAARLEIGKGPMVLLDALSKVNGDRRLAIARIAGTGPQLLQLKRRARELSLNGTCEFVGTYSEPLGRSAFMNSLDVFVLPSFAEGTPNSIVEAMAQGIPIIASDVGGIADMIGDDAGLLVPPGDVNALATAMNRLASDRSLRDRMGKSARERYQKLFSPAAVVPLLLDTYERLMANGNAPTVTQNGHHPWADRLRTNAGNTQ